MHSGQPPAEDHLAAFRNGPAVPAAAPAPAARLLPRLTIRSVPRYVAAVAEAVADGRCSPKEASALLYAVQVFVAAYKVLGPRSTKVRTIRAAAIVAQRAYPSPLGGRGHGARSRLLAF